MRTYQRRLRANIAAELGRNDMTQAQAAARLGMTPGGMANRMNGKVDFRAGELVLLSGVLHVPFSTLTAGVDELIEVGDASVAS